MFGLQSVVEDNLLEILEDKGLVSELIQTKSCVAEFKVKVSLQVFVDVEVE